ncbi:hypothetical protein A3737_26845 [Oleiphilus sp. HI0065]|nr:hypothetical protein A3737_26845 [Oleiphilus sp. HI0065]
MDRQSSGTRTHPSGLKNFPINIIPDHEHLYHAERTPEWVENWIKRYNWSDDYGSNSYYFSDWFDIFKNEILLREEQGGISHLLIHPITIYLCGGMKALNEVADFLGQFETCFVTEFSRSQNNMIQQSGRVQ